MIAVVGLCRGSGASTVARALGPALGVRDGAPSGFVWEMPLLERGCVPLARRRVDTTVLVAPGDGEPALAALAAELLRARLGRVLVAANRVRDAHPWSPHADVCLPHSRLAAAIAARGRVPPGELGSGLRRLAVLCHHRSRDARR